MKKSECPHDGNVSIYEVWTGETCAQTVTCVRCNTVIYQTPAAAAQEGS